MKTRHWIFIIIAGIAILAMSAFYYASRPGKGDAAPLLDLQPLHASSAQFDGFQDKVTLLHFWATWCGPCRGEIPSLEQLYQNLPAENFQMIAVSEDTGNHIAQKIEAFQKQVPFSFPVFVDPQGKGADAYAIFALPETIVIDRSGTIVKRFQGAQDWNDEALVQYLLGL